MKEISLSQGKVALVDDDDYERVNQYKWHVRKFGNIFYASRNIRLRSCKEARETGLPERTIVLMHRFIMNTPDDKDVDHINHGGTDNRKENLRECTPSQNGGNRLLQNGTSKYKGICWDRATDKWMARIRYKQKQIYLGRFINELEAARTYDKKAGELFGEFAYLNFPNE